MEPFQRKIGSVSVSGQLPTYPSPNSISTLTCCQWTVVELGGGVGEHCPDTDIDPKNYTNYNLSSTPLLGQK